LPRSMRGSSGSAAALVCFYAAWLLQHAAFSTCARTAVVSPPSDVSLADIIDAPDDATVSAAAHFSLHPALQSPRCR